MFTKIDIESYGLFKDFEWNRVIGVGEPFRKLNIIYGRNYSGKTTLSRIFRSVEKGEMHPDYSEGKFSISIKDGSTINETNLNAAKDEWTVRVYNSDFVNDNLSWLHNNDGTIEPFTILGSKNVEIDRQIKLIEEKMGSLEDRKGLLFELTEMGNLSAQKRNNYEKKNADLEEKLKKKAKSIKESTATYNAPTYNIASLKGDLPKAKSRVKLTDEEVTEKKRLLKDEAKSSINEVKKLSISFESYLTKSQELLTKKISVSEPIAELVNDSLLQDWVRTGLKLQKDKRSTCGFCGGPLSPELWTKLSEHFNQESESLRTELEELLAALKESKTILSAITLPDRNQLYSSYKDLLDGFQKSLSESIKRQVKSYDILIEFVQKRLSDVFSPIEYSPPIDHTSDINELLDAVNEMISRNNDQTNRLALDQRTAMEDLKLSEIAGFLEDINYDGEIADIEAAKSDYESYETSRKAKDQDLIQLRKERETLEAQAKDESKGAELVNQHLTHFFGHRQLRLVASGDTTNIKFKIVRDGVDAKNLSEGECSLISFCYFIAKMEDQMKDESKIEKLIIYIDDPISSLDTNHIFFMYSLIETVIAKERKYGQLFISTHNLDFLKYLKKLTNPGKIALAENTKLVGGLQHFLVERYNETNTQLKLSPAYLQKYVTEFNYLFNQIYLCANADAAALDTHVIYNFGNNMRKFFESFLFYKYPNNELNLEKRLTMFFDGDLVSYNLVSRVINEYSHLEELRGLEPIDNETMIRIAKTVITRMQQKDNDQYNALVASINS